MPVLLFACFTVRLCCDSLELNLTYFINVEDLVWSTRALQKLIELIETKVLKPNETHKPFENMKVEEAKKVDKKIHHNIGMEKIWLQ